MASRAGWTPGGMAFPGPLSRQRAEPSADDARDKANLGADDGLERPSDGGERGRDLRHPISRWYLLPVVDVLARLTSPTPLRPWHVTFAGLFMAALAAVALVAGWPLYLAAVMVLLAWSCDRLDGKLARRQRSATRFGAWLDATVDEVCDIGLHAAASYRAWLTDAPLAEFAPWLLGGFVAAKYLFIHSMAAEREITAASKDAAPACASGPKAVATLRHASVHSAAHFRPAPGGHALRRLVNLPANADVRLHLLLMALFTGWLLPELCFVAGYYALRWLARFALVPATTWHGSRHFAEGDAS